MFAVGRLATSHSRAGVQPLLVRAFATKLESFDCRLSIGVVGYGGIGRELIDQVGTFVKKSNSPAIHLRGIADIDGMCVNPTGMSVDKDPNVVAMGEIDAKTPMGAA